MHLHFELGRTPLKGRHFTGMFPRDPRVFIQANRSLRTIMRWVDNTHSRWAKGKPHNQAFLNPLSLFFDTFFPLIHSELDFPEHSRGSLMARSRRACFHGVWELSSSKDHRLKCHPPSFLRLQIRLEFAHSVPSLQLTFNHGSLSFA